MNRKSLIGVLLVLGIAIGITVRIAVRVEKIPMKMARAEANQNIIDPITRKPAKGGESLIWVYPTKDPNQDRPNIQWALDNITPEGTIVLKTSGLSGEAYFDLNREFQNYTFGNYICRSCTLKGEISSEAFADYHSYLDGKPKMTMIKNGMMLFGINWSGYCPVSAADKVVIKDLVSQGGRVFWCGAFQKCDVEINNVHIVDFAAYPDYPNLIGFYSHAKGRFAVKNCTIHEISSVPGINLGIAYVGLEKSHGAKIEITSNSIVTQGRGIGIGIFNNNDIAYNKDYDITITQNTIVSSAGIILKSEFAELGLAVIGKNKLINSIPVFIPSLRVGIQAVGLHDSVIKDNEISGNYAKGVELIYSQIRPAIDNNTIEANNIFLSSLIDRKKAYVVHDSIWFQKSSGNFYVDQSLYPHTRNNAFLNPIGKKEDNGLWLADIDQDTLQKYNPGINFNLFDVNVDPSPENPHSRSEALGPKFENMYKTWCKQNEGTWDGEKCVY
jgi:hypothetical protein